MKLLLAACVRAGAECAQPAPRCHEALDGGACTSGRRACAQPARRWMASGRCARARSEQPDVAVVRADMRLQSPAKPTVPRRSLLFPASRFIRRRCLLCRDGRCHLDFEDRFPRPCFGRSNRRIPVIVVVVLADDHAGDVFGCPPSSCTIARTDGAPRCSLAQCAPSVLAACGSVSAQLSPMSAPCPAAGWWRSIPGAVAHTRSLWGESVRQARGYSVAEVHREVAVRQRWAALGRSA